MVVSDASPENVKKNRTFALLAFVTLVYFCAYYFLVLETEACDPMQKWVKISPHWFLGFWDRYLGCRQVNELGDALAGAFAPVAFLWLAGAVHIQSQELAEQRRELNETQEVMREQLTASEAQVEETKASTALLKLQTEILENQNKLRLADDEFDKTLYLTKVKLSVGEEEFGVITHVGPKQYESYISGRLIKGLDDPDFFERILQMTRSATKRATNTPKSDIEIVNEESLKRFHELYSSLCEIIERCSPAYSRLASSYNIIEMKKNLDILLNTTGTNQT
jgi:hypothetical protein